MGDSSTARRARSSRPIPNGTLRRPGPGERSVLGPRAGGRARRSASTSAASRRAGLAAGKIEQSHGLSFMAQRRRVEGRRADRSRSSPSSCSRASPQRFPRLQVRARRGQHRLDPDGRWSRSTTCSCATAGSPAPSSGCRTMPSRVFHRNFWATFMVDTVGIELRHRMNLDHIMWSTDYPHTGSDWPNNRVTIERLFRGVPAAEVKKMLHDNCKALYRLDHVPDRARREPMPLAGLRVVELATDIAGPYATKLLADAGADVSRSSIRTAAIRCGAGPRPARRSPADEDGVLFRFLNTSKRSVARRLDARRGTRAAPRARRRRRPRRRERRPRASGARLARRVSARNPRASLVSISLVRPHGPVGRSAGDRVHAAGVVRARRRSRGTVDRPPIAAGGRLGEWLGGGYAAIGALAAVDGARRTGRGQHVDLSLLEVVHLSMAPFATVVASFARQPGAVARTVEIPSIEPAADGWVGFCTITEPAVARLPRADRARRPGRRRRRSRTTSRATSAAHEVVRDDPRLDAPAHRRRDRRARRRCCASPSPPIGNGETVTSFEHFVARGVFVPHPGRATSCSRGRPTGSAAATLRPAVARAPRARRARRRSRGCAGDGARAAARRAPATGAAAPAVRRPPRHRLHDVLGRPVRRPLPRRRWAPTSSRSSRSSVPTASASRARSSRPADRWWEWCAHVPRHQRRQARHHARPRRARAASSWRRGLIARADVVVENFSPRVLDNLGLRYEDLARDNPGLDHGAHAGLRARRSVARPRRLRADHGADLRAWRG